jgi:adenosine/AMP kinase
METKIVNVQVPEGCNVVLGQSHFIKTVNAAPNIKFGLAFCESSGPCLVRFEGNDPQLKDLASRTALQLGAGHTFIIFIQNAYPINVLDKIKSVPEVCNIFMATANPFQVILAETEQGRGILGVVDGFATKGIETERDVVERKQFLRKIGYKL